MLDKKVSRLSGSILKYALAWALIFFYISSAVSQTRIESSPHVDFPRLPHIETWQRVSPMLENYPILLDNYPIPLATPFPSDAPVFSIDLPTSTRINTPFKIDVSRSARGFDKHSNVPGKPIEVSMEQTNRVAYEPRVFQLKPGERRTVEARVLQSNSGLAEVTGSIDGAEIHPVVIDVGFSAHIKSDLGDSLEEGQIRSFSLEFVDDRQQQIRLDAPAKLVLETTGAYIRKNGGIGDPWKDSLELDLERGASSSPLLQIRSTSAASNTGQLLAKLGINDRYILQTAKSQFLILPPWWHLLLMAVLGGILYTIYEITKSMVALKKFHLRTLIAIGLPRIVTGALAGVTAYLLASYKILGINIETSSLRGFVVLGFLFAYIGIDLILKKITSQQDQMSIKGASSAAP